MTVPFNQHCNRLQQDEICAQFVVDVWVSDLDRDGAGGSGGEGRFGIASRAVEQAAVKT